MQHFQTQAPIPRRSRMGCERDAIYRDAALAQEAL